MHLTLAFSAQDFVKDVGSYAGFAAVVALALFALLLFAQAREIKRLREWGGQAHDRIGELERNVAAALDMARRAMARPAAPAPGPSPQQQARGPVARRATGPAQPAVAAAAASRVASTQAPVRPQLLPAAPRGVAGPALASATMLIPLPGKPEAAPLEAPVPARPATPAARPAAAISHAAAGAGAGAGATAVVRERDAVADDADGYDDDPPTEFPPPRRATPAARPAAGGPPRRGAGAPPAGRPRPGGRPQPAAPLRAPAGATRALPPEEEPPHGRRRLTAVLLSLVALVVVAGAVWFVAIRDTGSDTPTTRVEAPEGGATRRAAARRTQTQRQTTPAPAHGSIAVAVLNGTGLTGLAGRVMGELTAAGYPQGGVVADAGTTTASVTIVNYRDGREAAAREVARTLGLPGDAVDVMGSDVDAACAANSGGTCSADVVVVVGTDLQ